MMIMFRASQLYSHSFTFKHTHTHSRTDRLISAMYDNHIPCNSAVFTFIFIFILKHNHAETYLYNVWWSYSGISAVFTCTFTLINTQTHTHTHRLIFTMYDDHIPCIPAVFTFKHTHTHRQTDTYEHTHGQTDLFSQCMMIIFRATQLYSHSYSY